MRGRWWVALAAVLCAGAAWLWRPEARESPPPASDVRIPVLMVHGSGLSSATWNGLIAHLRQAGWPPEFLAAPDLEPDNGANVAAAREQLRPAAERLLASAAAWARRHGREVPARIAIVGHSMGAVSGRWLATQIMPERVALFVSVAGANHGTNAVCRLGGDGNDELCPAFPWPGESAVLDQLNGARGELLDETPHGVGADPPEAVSVPPTTEACLAWYVIYIEPDEWIEPAASALLAGAGGTEPHGLPAGIERVGPGTYRATFSVGHDDLPSSEPVRRLIAALLQPPTSCPAV